MHGTLQGGEGLGPQVARFWGDLPSRLVIGWGEHLWALRSSLCPSGSQLEGLHSLTLAASCSGVVPRGRA